MFLSSNELDLMKVTEWSAKSWQLSAVATILVKGADARFQPLTANRVFTGWG